MKILHLTTHLNIGGVSRYILMAAGRMVREGHEVWVLSSGGEWLPEFHAAGIRTVEFPIRTKNEFHPKLFWLLPRILRWVKKEKFDLLHAHTRVTQVMASFISKLAGIPTVSTAHGFFRRRFSRRLLDAWGERVIGISAMVAEDLKKTHRLSDARVRMVQNAIDVEEFQKRFSQQKPIEMKSALGITPGARVLTSVARLVKDKGHSYLIEALGFLKDRFPDLRLLIVGEGREHASLAELAKKTGVSGRVSMIPTCSDIPGILSMTDIFVHPANAHEGFGLSILEAMAVGKPVLITNIRSVNTLIHDLENGFVVEPGDAKALAGKIAWMFENSGVVTRVAGEGQKFALGIGSIDRQVRQILAVYKEVLR